MTKVPMSRFRREMNKWLTKQQLLTITRNGKPVAVFVPIKEYEELKNKY